MALPDSSTELRIGSTWTDVTSDVYGDPGITHRRGRSSEGARVDPASVAVTLKSPQGKYYPRNPRSAYYGLIGRNTPMRLASAGSDVALALPYGQSSGASTPDTAALDITGDIDVRAEMTPTTWAGVFAAGAFEVVGKYVTTGNQRSWRVVIWNSGVVEFLWSPNGTSTVLHTSSVPAPFAPRQRGAIRVTLDVNNGLGGYTVTWYTAPTLSGPWAALGDSVVTTSGVTSIYASTAPLEVGNILVLGYETGAGRVHGVEVRSGIGGTLVANPQFGAQPAGTTAFSDSAGRAWALTGRAQITDRWYRHHVEVPEWAPQWTVSGADASVSLQGAGILRRLGQGAKALDSTLRRRVPSYAPLAYWPLEDSAGSTQAYSPIAGVRPMTVAGVTFGQTDSLGGSAALPTIAAGGRLTGSVPAGAGASTEWSVHMVYTVGGTPPAADAEFLSWRTTGTVQRWRILQRTGTATIQGYDGTGALVVNQGVTVGVGVFAGWNRFYFRVTESAGTVTWVMTWFDIAGSGGQVTFSYSGSAGRVTQIDTTIGAVDDLTVGHVAVFPVAVTDAYTYAEHGFVGERASSRIARLCAEEGVPVIIVGATLQTAAMGPQRPDTLLNLLEECEASDGGILHEDRERLGLVYRARYTLYNQTPGLVLPYSRVVQPFAPVDDDTTIRNDITRSRIGGSSARVVADVGPLSVQASPLGVGMYDESVSLSLAADDQVEQIAGWDLHLGTWDEARYKSVRVLLHKHPDLVPAVLALDIGDVIRITDLPDFLPPGPIDLMVEGYQESRRNGEWEITFVCSPAGPWNVGVYDDAARGRYDTGGSVLSAAATATATTLSVAYTDGTRWITGAPNVVSDPSFEAGIGAWVCTRGATIGVTSWDRSVVHSGTGAVRLTRVHPTDTGVLNMSNGLVVACAPGQVWTGSAWVLSSVAASNAFRVGLVWRPTGGTETIIYGTAVPVTSASGWVQVTVSATIPATAVDVRLIVEGRSAWAVGEWWVADDVRLARTDNLVGDDRADHFPFDVTASGERMTVLGISGTTSPQAWTVTRSVNGISKMQAAGASVSLAAPTYYAL
ncbi:carbohydrate binding domain-containing protein [Streptomyces sp. NPDC002308]